jgi:hypothetical protein
MEIYYHVHGNCLAAEDCDGQMTDLSPQNSICETVRNNGGSTPRHSDKLSLTC